MVHAPKVIVSYFGERKLCRGPFTQFCVMRYWSPLVKAGRRDKDLTSTH